MSDFIILNNVRLSFPDLFEPKKFEDSGKARYSATFLVEPGSENEKRILAEIERVAKAKWPKDAEKIEDWRSNPQKFCFWPGRLKKYDGYEGMMALAAHRYPEQGAPGVFDSKGVNGKPNKLEKDSGKPYGGCYVNAKVEIWAQEGKYEGIRCTLVSVQFFRDGDAFSSGSRPSDDDFGVVEGADASDFE
jgi:hypothetical protein